MAFGDNFTMPSQNHQDPGPGGGTGAGGQVWNPKGGPNGTGAWEAPPDQSSGAQPVDAQGNPLYSSAWSDPTTGGVTGDTGAGTAGRVMPLGGAGAYGGYSGTMVRGPDGALHYDQTLNGRTEGVNRARGLGEAAANRGAYQIDYGTADKYAAMGQQSRNSQADATGIARNMALNGNQQSQALGQRMLQQGVQTQQAAAMSTRGDALSRASAMANQHAGQAAFLQQGNNQLQAQRADDMATGRGLYMQGATGMRAGDAAAQGLGINQAKSQMGQEIGQRELNQQGQMGYEGQGQAINKSAQDMALKSAEMAQGVDAAASLRAQRGADRDMAMGGAIVSAGGGLVASASGIDGKDDAKGGDPDPYSRAVSASDSRAKTKITSLAQAAMARKGY